MDAMCEAQAGNIRHLWSSALSSWLQIQRSGFDSRCSQIFWQVVGLGSGNSASWVRVQLRSYLREMVAASLQSREYGRGDPLRWSRDIFYLQTLALTSPTRGGRSVGLVRSRTKATGFSIFKHCAERSYMADSTYNLMSKWTFHFQLIFKDIKPLLL
jgi:hypothetical protein